MSARAAGVILATVLLASAGFPVAADIPFTNTILVYADPGRDWNPGSFDYYLAYIDKDGTPKDWLFDGFLFLSINTPSHRNFWDGKAEASDWDWWRERLFEKDRELDALEHDIQALEAKLGPAAPRKVIISIPRPPIAADATSQAAVIKDFVDRCVRRFAEKNYRSIALDGFYWFHEGVDGTNADLVNSLWQDLQAKSLRLYWIPYDVGHENRAHLEKWKAGGIKFDGVWLQPNYFWAERNAKYAAQDLDDTVSVARAMGAEVEIEFDRGAYTTGWKLGRFTHYLMSGDVYGYRNGPLTYYDGYQGYIKCGQSRNSVQRAIYEDVYWFSRKAYLPRPMTYPGVFFDKGGADDPAAQPQIGLWLEKGGAEAASLFIVEPDPNKDYLVILKTAGAGSGKLEAQVDGGWVPIEGTRPANGGGGEARLERFLLPRAVIQKVWKPKTPLVLPLRRTGGGTVTEAWARPDDFVFRYLKGKEPMETEMRLELAGASATLRNASGETVVGLRTAGRGAKGAGVAISDGPSRTKRAARGTDSENRPLWLTGKPDGEGNLTITLDPGVEIVELWAFPAKNVFHLRPGSCGDTRADLHIPGASLVPDGKWKLAGEFVRNYRNGLVGAGLQITAPPFAKNWRLVLLVDAEAAVELREQRPSPAVTKIGAGTAQRVSVALKPGEHRYIFTGPVALHDAWLEPK